jgi:hypothetical protein
MIDRVSIVDQPALVGDRDENVRTHFQAFGMLPAGQDFIARDPPVLQRDDRLIMRDEFAARNSGAQLLLQPGAGADPGIHIAFVVPPAAAPGILGGIERDVGGADQ